jgi:hypothetical protein
VDKNTTPRPEFSGRISGSKGSKLNGRDAARGLRPKPEDPDLALPKQTFPFGMFCKRVVVFC